MANKIMVPNLNKKNLNLTYKLKMNRFKEKIK